MSTTMPSKGFHWQNLMIIKTTAPSQTQTTWLINWISTFHMTLATFWKAWTHLFQNTNHSWTNCVLLLALQYEICKDNLATKCHQGRCPLERKSNREMLLTPHLHFRPCSNHIKMCLLICTNLRALVLVQQPVKVAFPAYDNYKIM